jgi:transposase
VIEGELEAMILRLHHVEKWPVGTISSQLSVHHSVVRRVLRQAGLPRAAARRASMIDPYLPFVIRTWERYPKLTARRIYDMVVERGYPGCADHFRHRVAHLRPKPRAEAYLRLKTLPGEQAQVDWAHFGKVQVGRATRPLMAFVMVLAYSRAIFVRFFYGQSMAPFLQGHVAALAFFGGCARVLLYDNLKSAVLERRGDLIRFHPTLLDIANHYRYEARPVAVGRGNEKGRVERGIRYVRDSFFAARKWSDLADLNGQAGEWALSVAMERRWPEDPDLTVAEAFEKERPHLLQLPGDPFPAEERVEVRVGKTPYVRFDGNDYSVPHGLVRLKLSLLAGVERVRVVHDDELVAEHIRSYDRRAQIEDEAHIKALVAYKKKAKGHRAIDRLQHMAPRSEALLQSMAECGLPLGPAVQALMKLLDAYGARAFQGAVEEALANGTHHPAAVAQVLDRRRLEAGAAPPVPIELPDDPRVRGLSVRLHALKDYDTLEGEAEDGNEDGDEDREEARESEGP